MNDFNFGPLPEPHSKHFDLNANKWEDSYSADQMKVYAREHYEAAIKLAFEVCGRHGKSCLVCQRLKKQIVEMALKDGRTIHIEGDLHLLPSDTAPVHAQAEAILALAHGFYDGMLGKTEFCSKVLHALAAPPVELPGKTQATVAELIEDHNANDVGSWLWSRLMAYCAEGTPLREKQRLFQIVKEARIQFPNIAAPPTPAAFLDWNETDPVLKPNPAFGDIWQYAGQRLPLYLAASLPGVTAAAAVILPDELKRERGMSAESRAWDDGWNNCLIEIRKLNPALADQNTSAKNVE